MSRKTKANLSKLLERKEKTKKPLTAHAGATNQIESTDCDLIEVKLMDELPRVSAIILPDRVFFGHHLAMGITEQYGCFEALAEEGKSFRDHFETLWNPNNNRSEDLNSGLLEQIIKH
jgi:hypothetical protein